MWEGCSCTSRSSGELQAHPGRRPGLLNGLHNASETHIKNIASLFCARQDKENAGASPGAAAKRRARLTFQPSGGYGLDMYKVDMSKLDNRQPEDPKTKELAETKSPRSPTSVI
jgi:hypothetical protein